MGFLDRFRKKATDVVDDQGEKIGAGIDKGAETAKDTLDSLDGKNDDIPDAPAEQPAQPTTQP
jgi:hypothetical protein